MPTKIRVKVQEPFLKIINTKQTCCLPESQRGFLPRGLRPTACRTPRVLHVVSYRIRTLPAFLSPAPYLSLKKRTYIAVTAV